jgi:hypothetical protein
MTEQTQEQQAAEKAKAKKTEVETVEMADGRKVDFPGKRKMLKESFIDDGGNIAVRIDFRNGATRTFPLHASLVTKFAAHGAEQKYGDETAGLDDVDDMLMAVDKLHSRLNPSDGTEPAWTMEREGSGMAGTSVLARALSEAKGTPIEKVREFLSKKTQAEKIALRNNPLIKPIVERIEAEKAAKTAKVDTNAMLSELDGLGGAGGEAAAA